jgi:threonine dehydrogenase-like Zn-dependent dehydrogenase
MLAIRLAGVRTIDRVEVEPGVPGPGQVRVRVGAVALCGSDLSAWLGRHPRIRPPVILGHELAGTVDAVGPGTAGPAPGTRVAVEPTVPCRTCPYCRSGRENICLRYRVLGEDAQLPGGLAGSVVVDADRAHPLPEGVGLEAGALVQPLAIGLHAVRDRARLAAGETALVVGAGAIGMGVLFAAMAAGASVVVAEPRPGRRRMAAGLGAERAVHPDEAEAVVRELTGGLGADVAFEAAGGPDDAPFDLAVRATARGGRVVALGSFAAPTVAVRLNDVKLSELTILGTQAHPFCFPDVIAAVAAGTTPAAALVTHRFPAPELGEALTVLETAPDAGKVVLTPAPA